MQKSNQGFKLILALLFQFLSKYTDFAQKLHNQYNLRMRDY